MKFYFSYLVILIAFLGCKDDKHKTIIDYAYIGGEIINPSANYVVLSKEEKVIDTIKLDGRNRFLHKVKHLKEGIYTFKHGVEYQMILLEPRDSVLFRLNTLDFDESLVFSGRGDKKNNYLINEFLENEREEKYVIKLCQLNPNAYQTHIDSLKDRKVKLYERFIDKHEPSELFKKIAQANIDYSHYSNKEVYPFIHYGRDKASILKSLPDDFYDYRKHINYNDEFLSSYHNYNTFLRHSLSNLSLKVHDAHNTGKPFNRNSLCYNLDKLKLVDSLVTNTAIKDDLLYHFTMNYLSRSKNEKNNNIILKSYLSKTNSTKGKEKMTGYTYAINSLKEGSEIPDIELIDLNNEVVKLSSLTPSTTVVTFWSNVYYKHFKESHFKLKKLRLKYPEVTFISINIDGLGVNKSKKILEKYNFESSNAYLFKNPKEATDVLAVYPLTKTIILDKNNKIENCHTNIFSVYFEKQLLGLLNK
ncbi:hypothetical protein VOI54_16910 [Tamlana sp. 2201CG12-4]|uniref:TlpA family protein disulfide reductase n=1 Tax=Tamlana sp. 2201CG12-4 TaxID=3112582 RepID=UPI002DBC1940|nr:hypothetical protein [Tamlana sp. 2201CG12-4]MEC3908711.1 hypothetical protein [Tamlana sp. 2201CG12-4]